MTDLVNNPPHYQTESGLEAIDVIEAFFENDHYLATTFKYMARAGKKDPKKLLEDLKKARWYLDRKIAREEARPVATPNWESVAQEFRKWLVSPPEPLRYPLPYFDPFLVPKPKPRVFESISDVPEGIEVVDKEGDHWKVEDGEAYFDTKGNHSWTAWETGRDREYAPFTELLQKAPF